MPNSTIWEPTHICEIYECDAEMYSHEAYLLHMKVKHENDSIKTFCGHTCEGVQTLMKRQKPAREART